MATCTQKRARLAVAFGPGYWSSGEYDQQELPSGPGMRFGSFVTNSTALMGAAVLRRLPWPRALRECVRHETGRDDRWGEGREVVEARLR